MCPSYQSYTSALNIRSMNITAAHKHTHTHLHASNHLYYFFTHVHKHISNNCCQLLSHKHTHVWRKTAPAGSSGWIQRQTVSADCQVCVGTHGEKLIQCFTRTNTHTPPGLQLYLWSFNPTTHAW